MPIKRIALLLALVLAFGAGGVAFAMANAAPAPADIMNRAAAALQNAQDGHAVLAIQATAPDHSGAMTVEAWAKKLAAGPPPSYAFRAEVRQTSEAQAQGAVAVSDGQTVWLYAPSQNKVWTGTVADMRQGHNGALPFDSPQALIQQLLDLTTATVVATEPVQGHSAFKLQFIPRPDKVPATVAGATGLLWVDAARWLPLQATFNAGAVGQGQVTATTLELNVGVPDERFSFQPPPGAAIVPLQQKAPQHLSLSEADKVAGFRVLQPSYLPTGATLVDVLKTGNTIILRYEAAAGSFAIAQGAQEPATALRAGGEAVSVRGADGTLVKNQAGTQVLLFWTENGRTYSVSGPLSAQEALQIAGSLQ